MCKLSGNATKVFIAISRKTIGWHKDIDKISLSQMMKMTGLSKNSVLKGVKELEENEIIIVKRETEDKQKKINEYEINYGSPGEQVVPEMNKGGSQNEQIGSSQNEHTKETITKETITKEIVQLAEHETSLDSKIIEHFSIYSEKLGNKYYHDGKEAKSIKTIIKRAEYAADENKTAEDIILQKLELLYNKIKNPENAYWSEKIYAPSVLVGNWNNLVRGKTPRKRGSPNYGGKILQEFMGD
jgi:phage replication O-like protein O